MAEDSPPSSPGKPVPSTNSKRLPTQRKKRSKDNKRFSDEQIKSLESIFKLETKLDPRKKIHVARELGLQPRQVSIWFQNRRARWKSKQIEQDYRVLKANYENLNSHFESLKKEKESLLMQLQKLRELQKYRNDEDKESNNRGKNVPAGNLNDKDTNPKLKTKQACSNEGQDQGMVICSDDEKKPDMGYLRQEEESGPYNLYEPIDASLISIERRSKGDIGGFLDDPYESSNWWDIWT